MCVKINKKPEAKVILVWELGCPQTKLQKLDAASFSLDLEVAITETHRALAGSTLGLALLIICTPTNLLI